MAPRPALVKLGGSLLTDKGREAAFQPDVAARLLGEVAQARQGVILLHGAGSFGHPQARRAGLPGPSTPAGVAALFASLSDLEANVLATARDAGLPAVPVPLHLEARIRRGRLRWDPAPALRLLGQGFTPVLHGTLVAGPQGWQVVSADALMAHLAAQAGARVALFATDVDGVYDRGPRDPTARLLPQVDRRTLPTPRAASDGPGADVTGRMAGKLEHALAAARHVPTLIINGGAPGRLLACLQGRPVVGTTVKG